jgi:group I intron endonuclease
MIGVYKITNGCNLKCYIGSSKYLPYRWYRHKTELRKNNHCNQHLQRAWDKYGEENFYFTILQECEEEVLADCESHWMQQYDSLNNGYNLISADRHTVSKETSKKISKGLVGNKNALGFKHTNESKLKISLAGTGKVQSKETIAKRIKKLKGKIRTEEQKNNMRKPHSSTGAMTQEHKNKIALALMGNKNGLRNKNG